MSTVKNIVRTVGYQHMYSASDLISAAHMAANMPGVNQQAIRRLIIQSEPPTGKVPRTKYERHMVLRVRDKVGAPWEEIVRFPACYNRMFTSVADMADFFDALVAAARGHRKHNIRIVVTCQLRERKTDNV